MEMKHDWFLVASFFFPVFVSVAVCEMLRPD